MSMIDISEQERKIAGRINPEAANNLAVTSEAGGLSFATMNQVMEFAKMMAIASVAVPKHLRGNPGACMAVVMQAVEWRLSPFAVANKSYSVNDRLAYESQLVQAVILQRAPIKGRFKVEYAGEGESRVCKVSATLRDGDTVDYTSPPFGKITPKNSPLWKSDPDQQQFYYSGRALCRRHFPDVLLGVYAEDEIERDPRPMREVNPQPKGMAARLDALAAKPEPVAHDPETGEIAPQRDASPVADVHVVQVQRESAGDAGDFEANRKDITDISGNYLSPTLLDMAREVAMDGRRAFDVFYQALKAAEQLELKPDMAALLRAAGAADGRA